MIFPPTGNEWRVHSFTGTESIDEGRFVTALNDQQLLGLLYLKSVRRSVVGDGKSFMASFDGPHRSGKSLAAVTFSAIWDPTFLRYMERRIVQEPREFADAVENLASINQKGACVVVDEAGVTMSSQDWFEKWLKAITKMVQMFGYLHPMVMFVAPVKDFVDSRLRKMFHTYYKCSRHSTQFSIVKPYEVQFNSIFGKWGYRKPVIELGGNLVTLDSIRLGKPPVEILERYQALETSRKPQMLENFFNDLRKVEIEESKEKADLNKLADHVLANHHVFETRTSAAAHPKLSEILIQYGLKVKSTEARYIKSVAERKMNQRDLVGEVFSDEKPAPQRDVRELPFDSKEMESGIK